MHILPKSHNPFYAFSNLKHIIYLIIQHCPASAGTKMNDPITNSLLKFHFLPTIC